MTSPDQRLGETSFKLKTRVMPCSCGCRLFYDVQYYDEPASRWMEHDNTIFWRFSAKRIARRLATGRRSINRGDDRKPVVTYG